MPQTIERPRPAAYAEDYCAWIDRQIDALRSGSPGDIDRAHLIEELADLGNSERDQIESRLTVLLAHLLKWQFQPGARSPSWRASVVEQRLRIRRVLDRSPSLRPYPDRVLADCYEIARLRAAGETGLPEAAFPPRCPYAIGHILDAACWPD